MRTGPYSVGRMADGNGNAPGELFLIDGNSLAYRAFFALPESIATSTGFPTNAIFGFASMLVKILTEHGDEADGRRLGRRRARPQGGLRRVQGAAHARARTCSSSSGRTSSRSSRRSATATCRVEGYEADDVIASLAERAPRGGPPGRRSSPATATPSS